MAQYFLRDYTISGHSFSYDNFISEIQLNIACIGEQGQANFIIRLEDFLRQINQENENTSRGPSLAVTPGTIIDLKTITPNNPPIEKSCENKDIEKPNGAIYYMEP